MRILELIVWRDITSHTNEWFDLTDLSTFDACVMYTAGWVLEETNDLIKVSSTHSDPFEDEHTFGHDTVIPKGCIIERKVLRKRWATSRKKDKEING